MITRRRFLSLAGSSAITGGVMLLAGCSSKPVDADATPSVRMGEERCAYCTMLIDDVRFTAAWRTADGIERHFDDIGCMVNGSRRDAPPTGTRYWVHDYRTAAWLRAGEASFVISPAIKTPMTYGVAAFASAVDASGVVPSASPSLTWADVLQTVERKG